jgi:chorismate synthase
MEFDVGVRSHTVAIGEVWVRSDKNPDWNRVENSPLRCTDSVAEQAMTAAIDQARADGDSLGGVFELVAGGLPAGLGSHVHWDRRLDGRVAQAIMSINAVKGVEVGAGFVGAGLKGSRYHDIIEPVRSDEERRWARRSNNAGGLEGGMTNGQPLVVRAALKPIPTLAMPLPSADLHSGELSSAHVERSDVCVVPAAGVVGEAMLAWVLAEAWLEKFGGDHLEETGRNYQAYVSTMRPRRR